MNIRQLQLDDWVSYSGEVCRVTAVRADNDGKVRVVVENDDFCGFVDEVEPIQLTAEILKKNEFEFLTEDEKYKTFCLNKPYINCTFVYINCTFVKEFKDWMIIVGAVGSVKKRFVEASKVQFVHEMQHLLRLAQIEKEIEL